MYFHYIITWTDNEKIVKIILKLHLILIYSLVANIQISISEFIHIFNIQYYCIVLFSLIFPYCISKFNDSCLLLIRQNRKRTVYQTTESWRVDRIEFFVNWQNSKNKSLRYVNF